MKREALIRELRKMAKAKGVEFSVNTSGGKGSHYKITAGDKTTIIKGGELSPRYAKLVKQQLGLS